MLAVGLAGFADLHPPLHCRCLREVTERLKENPVFPAPGARGEGLYSERLGWGLGATNVLLYTHMV